MKKFKSHGTVCSWFQVWSTGQFGSFDDDSEQNTNNSYLLFKEILYKNVFVCINFFKVAKWKKKSFAESFCVVRNCFNILGEGKQKHFLP